MMQNVMKVQHVLLVLLIICLVVMTKLMKKYPIPIIILKSSKELFKYTGDSGTYSGYRRYSWILCQWYEN